MPRKEKRKVCLLWNCMGEGKSTKKNLGLDTQKGEASTGWPKSSLGAAPWEQQPSPLVRDGHSAWPFWPPIISTALKGHVASFRKDVELICINWIILF